MPTLATTGLVAITVPAGTATGGSGTVIALPADLASADTAGAPRLTLADGRALPGWIRYMPGEHSIVLGAVPDGSFPVVLMLQVGNQRSLLQISEEKGN